MCAAYLCDFILLQIRHLLEGMSVLDEEQQYSLSLAIQTHGHESTSKLKATRSGRKSSSSLPSGKF